MAREILINAAPYETRVAVVERQRLIEVFIERTRDKGVAGNIYKGRVTRVLPGMQAAFIDIGLEKAAFLHGSDLYADLTEEFLAEEGNTPIEVEGDAQAANGKAAARRVPIEERLKKGQEILVQVAKQPIGTKGARVTAVISLPGRHLVFIPSSQHVGVSRRIEDEAERARLKEIVRAERPPEGGFIIRTACEGLSKREIQGDIRFLLKLWKRIVAKSEQMGAAALVHYDMDLVLRTVRDLFTADTQRLVVDNPRDHQRILDFVDTVMPRMQPRVELYEDAEPLFDRLGIEPQITKALERKVWLKSGGYIVIDHTEALTVIDVNTGRYVGKKDQEETVLKTNLEAVKTIVEQLRLRNIGGLIVIDFIDMEEPANQREVFEALGAALKKDKARSKLLPISELGLIEMTRKRTRESLTQLLCSPCPACDAKGHIKATATIAYEVLRRVQREAALNPKMSQITAHVHPTVAQFLHQHEDRTLQALEATLGRKITVKAGSDLDESRYEVTGVEAAA
ncbi:MAG TPA: Rne/Rng family ribonuclease [Candidatus Margulisiibacteriota bacterium]|nr:Rne/Rng family ribonuclease [Candidatus Margulisiibacteriota bacterium]